MKKWTTISIDPNVKKALEGLALPRESWNDTITRLIDEHGKWLQMKERWYGQQ